MEQKKIYELINKDNLQKALETLLVQNSSLKKNISQIKGRLQNLEAQNRNGTISQENYSIERNRIREAVLDLVSGETSTSLPSNNTRNYIIGGIVGILLLGGGYFLIPKSSSTNNHNNTSITKTEQKTESPNEITASKEKVEVKEKVEQLIFRKTFSLPNYKGSFNISRNYKQFIAKMTRKFSWKTIVSVKDIPGKTMQIDFDETTKVLNLVIPNVQMKEVVAIEDKTASTVSNELWINENDKDGGFWQGIDGLAKNMLNDVFLKNKNVPRDYGNKIKSELTSDIESTLDSNDIPYASVNVQLGKLILLNKNKVNF